MRQDLPRRRASETTTFQHGGAEWTASWSRYADGRLAELFVSAPRRVGSDTQLVACDGAVLVSLALQHGASVGTVRHALLRSPSGAPMSAVCAALDEIERGAL